MKYAEPCNHHPYHLKKQQVASSFSQAAKTYDAVAQLQRDIGSSLLTQLSAGVGEPPKRVLDLGSGTGYFTPKLRDLFPAAELYSLDLAEGMLSYARDARPVQGLLQVCGDAENLPLANNSIDLIFSNLALQWCQHPAQLFSEISRVLAPKGQIYLATLGPKTLHELRAAWQAVDDQVHVNRFIPMSDLVADLSRLQQVSATIEQRTCRYEKVLGLLQELKGIGAHNVNEGKPKGLSSPARLRELATGYEPFRDADQLLPATYEVYYLVLEKP